MLKNVFALASALFVGHLAVGQCDLLRGPVVINEFLAFNTSIAQNSIGAYEDYVELYNTSSQPFNMEGWFLSDSRGRTNRTKFRFPNVTIPGNGYLIVWCDGVGDPFMPGLNAAFSLSSTEGEKVVLSNPDTVIVDFVRFGPILENVGMGRFPNGTGSFTTMIPSYNGPNFNGDAFNVVINEWLASNSSSGSDAFGEFDDWIELYNNGNASVNLSGYLLSDNENNPSKFTFPEGSVIGPNQYLIVWADNQPEQGPLHASFALSASGEEVILSRPDTSTVDYYAFGPQQTDISEGRFPNGLGNIIPCMAPTFSAFNLGTVSAEDVFAVRNDLLEVFPNPASSQFRVTMPSELPELVRITDLSGRVLIEVALPQKDAAIDIAHLPPAVYLVMAGGRTARLVKIE